MSFESPLFLLALLAVPAVVALYVVHHRRRSRVAAQFASPALLPNVVDREPGRLRHVPPAILLIALTALLVAFARPQAEISVPRENATIMLAIDTSRSMAAKDVPPTRLAAATKSIRDFLAKAPDTYRIGVVSFASAARVVAPPTRDRGLVELAMRELRVGEGTALGDAIVKAVEVGQAAGRSSPDDEPTPTTVLLISDGKEDGGDITPQRASQTAQQRGVTVNTVALGTADGVVEVPARRRLHGASPGAARPEHAARDRADDRRQVLRSADGRAAAGGVRRSRVAARRGEGVARGDGRLRGSRRSLAARGWSAIGRLVQEAPVRALGLLAAAAAALAVLVAPSAQAADECRGLPVCIPVAGPWVVIPATLQLR